MRRLTFATIALAALAALALGASAACGGASSDGAIDLATLPASVAAHYRFVEANQPLVEQLPCYCGCGATLNHRHLRDCFVRDDGGYDPHAAGCGICIAEAAQTEDLLAAGEGPAAIRASIDERYGEVGPPTDTPPVGGF
jgi:hypothetical protein